MKRAGHYWCDDCDEPAIAGRCRKGHHVRFVPAPPVPARHPVQARATPEAARSFFAQLHHHLNCL